MKPSKSPLPVVVVSAVLGAGVAIGLVSALDLGGGGKTTTVVQQAPLAGSRQNASDGGALTARDIYKRDAPGVVFIRAQIDRTVPSLFGFPEQQQGTATGSGFVIDKKGTIVTNAHVVDGASKVTVTFADNKSVSAKVQGADRSSDIAVLKVNPDGLALDPLSLGSASEVQVGDPVVAIGNPFGLDRTLTTGVVSAKQRQIQGLNGFQINDVIQTDAAINPGNSGGPLIDGLGHVIGINSQIETGNTGNSGNVGIGFAIPIDKAKQIIPQLERTGHVQTAFLGITSLTIDSSLRALNLPVSSGALVQSVEHGSPAAKAGIKGGDISASLNGDQIVLGGDIIVGVDGKPVRTSDDLLTLVTQKKPGDTVSIQILRQGKKQTVKVRLGNRPQQAPQSQQQP
jgi:S1-C subfamily serine protease